MGLGAVHRLGHSVETLVTYDVGALQGDDVTANERIDVTLYRPVIAWLCAWLRPAVVPRHQATAGH